MNLYTIYDSPSDYPDTYIARRFEIIDYSNKAIAREVFMIDKDLDKIRNELRGMGLFSMPRDESDDKNIVETWF